MTILQGTQNASHVTNHHCTVTAIVLTVEKERDVNANKEYLKFHPRLFLFLTIAL